MRRGILCWSIFVLFVGFVSAQEQSAEPDFQPQEVLFGYGGESPFECYYYVGTIVSPASVKTNNQAEVLAVRDGKRYWSRFVFKTHKAETMELKLTTFVFYPLGFPDTKQIDTYRYRSTDWAVGQVSSIQKISSEVVEVDGTPFDIGLLRISDAPLQKKY
jgi:hypothetical protein